MIQGENVMITLAATHTQVALGGKTSDESKMPKVYLAAV
jgi:hypothetical protein